MFRAILRTDAVEQRKADRIAEETARLGLEPSPPPEPLPIIAEDDIHLICWQAIVPGEVDTLPEATASEQADLFAPDQTVLLP